MSAPAFMSILTKAGFGLFSAALKRGVKPVFVLYLKRTKITPSLVYF
jgi:hypothetical protein